MQKTFPRMAFAISGSTPNCWQQLLITMITRMLLISTCPKTVWSVKTVLALQWRSARTKNRAVAEAGVGGRARLRPEDEDAAEARVKSLRSPSKAQTLLNFKKRE